MANTILEIAGDYVILKSDKPYERVLSIIGCNQIYTTESPSLLTQFRWSRDTFSYSNWMEITNENLSMNLPLGEDSLFWIQFKIELLEDGHTEVERFDLVVTYHSNKWDNFSPFPIEYNRESGHNYYPVKNFEFGWNNYKFNAAIKLHKDLSFIVNKMLGQDVQYYKADPLTNSRDSFMMEWGLLEYRDASCIKVVVPRNEFPDNKFNFTPFGIEFEMPFEVHIDKRYFEWAFGNSMGPQKYDAIYIPLNDRMYIVDSSTLERNFMAEPIYWKVILKKHTKPSHVIPSQSMIEDFDDLTTSMAEVFGKDLETITEDIVDRQQTVEKTTYSDIIRIYEINNLINQYNLTNHTNVIAQYFYNSYTSFLEHNSSYMPAVQYKYINSFPVGEDRVYTAWFNMPETEVNLQRPVTSIEITDNIYTINFLYEPPRVVEGQYIKLIDTSNSNFYIVGQVTEVFNGTESNYVKMIFDEGILTKAYQTNNNWLTSTTLKGQKTYRRNLFYAYNETTLKGIQIDIYDNKLCVVTNNIYDWINLPNQVITNKWYAIVVSFLNSYHQFAVNLYERKPESERTTTLKEVLNYTVNNVPERDMSSNLSCTILTSPLLLTNIRYINETLDKEKHDLWLNLAIIKDSSKAFIIDNAIPKLRLPYIGEIK